MTKSELLMKLGRLELPSKDLKALMTKGERQLSKVFISRLTRIFNLVIGTKKADISTLSWCKLRNGNICMSISYLDLDVSIYLTEGLVTNFAIDHSGVDNEEGLYVR